MGGWVSQGPFSTFYKNCLNGFWKPNNQFKSIKFFHLFGWEWGVVGREREREREKKKRSMSGVNIIVYKSMDGKKFVRYGTVPGAGTV